jgi:nitrogen-specific signal transduction histidine kinase
VRRIGIIKLLIMIRIRQKLRRYVDMRSISFRLYLIIIPATVLSILLISYVDSSIAARLLEDKVTRNTTTLANQLAADLSREQTPLPAEILGQWLRQLLETNAFATRIEVFKLENGILTRISTTSSSMTQPTTIDELIAVQQSQTAILHPYNDRERTLKVIVPYQNPFALITGCVSVSSSLRQADDILEVHQRIDIFLIPASVLLLVVLLHYLFVRGLTGRIGRLGQAMTEARSGALEKRAPVDRHDELGVIAQLFNETMEEIERASRERDRLLEEQKDFNARLRARVQEATQELSSANLRLSQANQDLIDTQRRLTRYERMAVAGQMAAAFAHEVGSPLSAISTHLELMAEERSCSEETRRRIRLIQEQLNRITGFVEELLAETRAAAQAFGRVRLNDILQQLVTFLGQHFERHRIVLESRLQPDLPEIEANGQQLQQVFLNLLNNAADAMPNGGTIRVDTGTEADAGGRKMTWATVSDSGVGISHEEQKRIFEPFFSTKDFRRGTGLGLSIAARIIRQHEGTIGLESEPGKGTTFKICFPALDPDRRISEEVTAR